MLEIKNSDIVGTNTTYADLALVESSLLIIVASLPSTYPLLARLLPRTAEARVTDLRNRTFHALQIQKIDRKTGLPVPIDDPHTAQQSTDTTGFALADLRADSTPPTSPRRPTLEGTLRSESARLARGAGGAIRADTSVQAEPVPMPRSSGFDPLPRAAEYGGREPSVPDDEIRICREVEVSFV